MKQDYVIVQLSLICDLIMLSAIAQLACLGLE